MQFSCFCFSAEPMPRQPAAEPAAAQPAVQRDVRVALPRVQRDGVEEERRTRRRGGSSLPDLDNFRADVATRFRACRPRHEYPSISDDIPDQRACLRYVCTKLIFLSSRYLTNACTCHYKYTDIYPNIVSIFSDSNLYHQSLRRSGWRNGGSPQMLGDGGDRATCSFCEWRTTSGLPARFAAKRQKHELEHLYSVIVSDAGRRIWGGKSCGGCTSSFEGATLTAASKPATL